MKRRIHLVIGYVGGVAKASCGKYVGNDTVTAYRREVTCVTCKSGKGAR